jgi:hypothetical protein
LPWRGEGSRRSGGGDWVGLERHAGWCVCGEGDSVMP